MLTGSILNLTEHFVPKGSFLLPINSLRERELKKKAT